jgi:hypothetical protein
VVVSYRLWRSQFGGGYGIVGRQVRVDGGAATVIGITRPEFDFPRDADIWLPLRAAWPGVEQSPDLRVFGSVARLRDGVSPAQAQARLDVIARQSESIAAAAGDMAT